MEKVSELKTVRVRQMCEQPGCDGEMLPTGLAYSTYPELIEHKCNKCGCVAEYNVSYPTIRYIEIDNQD